MQWVIKPHDDYKYQWLLTGLLNHNQLIIFKKTNPWRYILPFNITIPKWNQIENNNDLKYNYQSLNSSCEKICVGNGRLFYFGDDGIIDIYSIWKRRYPVIKNNSSVIFIGYTEMNWKHED